MQDSRASIPWRLGLDLGVGSIGWSIYAVEPKPASDGWYVVSKLLDGGVTIFGSGTDNDNQSAAVQRRTFRSQRRRTRNTRTRKLLVLRRLISLGLLPADRLQRRRERDTTQGIDGYDTAIPATWAWRWRGVNGHLGANELGYVLMALAAARGQTFADDTEAGKRFEQATELQKRVRVAGCRTFGEYAAVELARCPGSTVRARDGVANYCTRTMVMDEFEAICAKQVLLIGDEVRKELRGLIFDQELTAVLPAGSCPLVAGEPRLPRAHPLVQQLKVCQTLRNIELRAKGGYALDREGRLTPDEASRAVRYLRDKRRVTPSALLKALGLKNYSTNYHKQGGATAQEDVDIVGDETGAVLSNARAFGTGWFDLPEGQRASIVEELLSYRDNDPATGRRRRPDFAALAARWSFGEEAIRAAFAALPRGRSAYGATATRAILERMTAHPDENFYAARRAVYPETGMEAEAGGLARLPYYGAVLKDAVFDADRGPQLHGEIASAHEERHYGRVRNPQVHVVMQQVRGLVNALIDEHGKPVEAVVELARDLCEGEQAKRKTERRMRERRERRDAAGNVVGSLGVTPTADHIDRYLLWEELGPVDTERVDIYSGRRIANAAMLYNGEVEVDHIIPRSLCGDDSLANKIVTFRDANQAKIDQMPFQAFTGEAYDAVKRRAYDVYGSRFDAPSKRKYRRFLETAKEEFTDQFVGRELSATAYAAKLVRRYLGAVIPADRVYAAHGRLTGRLRKAWGLTKLLPEHAEARAKAKSLRAEGRGRNDELKRFDHRHHLIDAAVAGRIDPTTIRFFFSISEGSAQKLDFEYRADLAEVIRRTIVRHRPKHKRGETYSGAIVNATRYRIKRHPVSGKQLGSTREAIASVAFEDATWKLGKDVDFSSSLMARLRATGAAFSKRELAVAERVFAQERYDAILAELKVRDNALESARVSTAHREEAWKRLCNEFTRTIGRKSYRKWSTKEAVFRTRDGAWVESGGYAYANVYIGRKKGKPAYRLSPVSIGNAIFGSEDEREPGETLVCRLHQGDMLRLKTEKGPAFVVVRAFSDDGRIRITLHYNAARCNGRALSANPEIEGSTSSRGDRTVGWLFGTMTARIAHIGPLGRPR